ncbi:hypothetical protein ACIA98_36160 [Streptomyces sp. NPDC051366]|uniref:hypothetical protein n=1 Tax=Streptomyces sp. NPDC051366 TaxID=3365652 RepID=UPI0037B9335F
MSSDEARGALAERVPAGPHLLRRAGLDLDGVRLDDALLIEWRGGGPAVWHPDTGHD